jgi:hypothetical protein
MTTFRIHPTPLMQALYLSAVAWSCTPALAAGDAAAADAATRYQRERALCASSQSKQERAACTREAAAAHAQMRRHGMQDNEAHFDQNAQKRCDALPAGDRTACQARMQGQGSTTGSVSGGGIYRELVTTVPVAPAGAKPLVAMPLVPAK